MEGVRHFFLKYVQWQCFHCNCKLGAPYTLRTAKWYSSCRKKKMVKSPKIFSQNTSTQSKSEGQKEKIGMHQKKYIPSILYTTLRMQVLILNETHHLFTKFWVSAWTRYKCHWGEQQIKTSQKAYLFKDSFLLKANAIEKVVWNWRCIPSNHPERYVVMQSSISFSVKNIIKTKFKFKAIELWRKTYEHIISRLTELVCLGVNE